jgi:hypothetical protein
MSCSFVFELYKNNYVKYNRWQKDDTLINYYISQFRKDRTICEDNISNYLQICIELNFDDLIIRVSTS